MVIQNGSTNVTSKLFQQTQFITFQTDFGNFLNVGSQASYDLWKGENFPNVDYR